MRFFFTFIIISLGCYQLVKADDVLAELTELLSQGSYSTYSDPNSVDFKLPDVEVIPTTITPSYDWNISCRKDRFTDIKSCFMTKIFSDLMVGIVEGHIRVFVGKNHFPNTQSAIKIDKNATVYGKEGSISNPKQVIQQLRNGKVAYLRYQEWPYQYYKDSEVDLKDFSKNYEEMLKEYRKL